MSLESLMDKDDRDRERRERLEAERKARGEPEPIYVFKPPPSNRKVNWIRAKVCLPDGMDSSDIDWN